MRWVIFLKEGVDLIISIAELKKEMGETELTDASLERKMKAIEQAIRAYTNNNFQNRAIRFVAPSDENSLLFTSPYIAVNDTLQITQSINQGLYKITEIDDCVKCDGTLYPCKQNLITKVEYPDDVIEGCINLLKWDIENRDKTGVQSETISRHSVTYFNQDASNTAMGYPIALLGFLKPYVKARF